MDVVRLKRKELLIGLVGRLEPVAPVELHGGTAGGRGDVEASSAVRARETSNLFEYSCVTCSDRSISPIRPSSEPAIWRIVIIPSDINDSPEPSSTARITLPELHRSGPER